MHIAVAGAGGWIGLATLDLLEQVLGDRIAERVSCYGSSERTLRLRSGRELRQSPLSALPGLDAKRIWLLHFAFQTKDRAEALSEDDYRTANEAISATVDKAVHTLPVEAMFVASSGAATKAHDPSAAPAMRLYGQMKLEDEERFARWAEGSGHRAVIGRIFNITGPYINKHQAYAIANFISDALGARTIAVRAPREVFRGYVAIRELMSLVFALMAQDDAPVARFDSGGTEMELETVARIVHETLGGSGVDRAPVSEPAADRYCGDDRAYRALLARHGIPVVPLDRQIVETAEYMQAVIA